MSIPTHNLTIQSYSLDEILGLFDLNSYDISIENLKVAKKKVLMLHPDKSKLDAKYFLFYKKAFDIIVQFFDNQNRQNRSIQPKDVAYEPNYNDQDTNTTKQITKNVQEMKSDNFQEKFNELFEANKMGVRPNTERNEWFQQEKSAYDVPQEKMSKQDMNDNFQRIKDQNNGLIQYNGVQSLNQDSAS